MGTCRSVSRCAGDVVRNSFFSGVVTLSNSVISERLLCADRMRYIWSETIRGLSVGNMWRVYHVSLQGVHQFESPRLSDMSNPLFVAIST
jgi:hypothetical protein